MVRIRPSTASTGVALLLSLALHMGVIIPALFYALTQRDSAVLMAASDSMPAPPLRDIQLGIEADTPSSYTWLGYDTYEEQIAEKADTEQAAFAEDLPGGAPAEAKPEQSAQQPAPPMEEAQVAPPSVPLVKERISAPEPTQFPVQQPVVDPMVRVDPSDELKFTSFFGPAILNIEELMRTLRANKTAADEALKEAEQIAKHVPEQKTPVEVPTPAEEEPSQASQPGKPVERPGQPAEKESDATSIVTAKEENWKLGKPLAANGVELFTARPDITLFTRLTSAARNPVVAIHLNHDGEVVLAEIVIASGDWRVDDAIRASLYKWHGKGKALDALEGEDTFQIVLRYVIAPGRDAG